MRPLYAPCKRHSPRSEFDEAAAAGAMTLVDYRPSLLPISCESMNEADIDNGVVTRMQLLDSFGEGHSRDVWRRRALPDPIVVHVYGS